MARLQYGVIHTENVRATKGMGGRVYSIVADQDLQNGMLVTVGEIVEPQTDARAIATTVEGDLGKGRICVVATPEVNYEENSVLDKALVYFNIPSGEIADAVPLETGDELAISDNMIQLDAGVSKIEDAKYLTLGTDRKWKAVATKPLTGIVCKVQKVKSATKKVYYGNTGTLIGLDYKLVKFSVETI